MTSYFWHAQIVQSTLLRMLSMRDEALALVDTTTSNWQILYAKDSWEQQVGKQGRVSSACHMQYSASGSPCSSCGAVVVIGPCPNESMVWPEHTAGLHGDWCWPLLVLALLLLGR